VLFRHSFNNTSACWQSALPKIARFIRKRLFTVYVYCMLFALSSIPNSHDATLPLPSLLSAPSFFLSSLLSPFHGIRGMTPKNIFAIKVARRRVLEHFGHKNQHLYEPDFLTISCNKNWFPQVWWHASLYVGR